MTVPKKPLKSQKTKNLVFIQEAKVRQYLRFFTLGEKMSRTVTIVFEDNQSLTSKEIKDNLAAVYGNNADIEVSPGSSSPSSYIQYGISELLTPDQAHIFFDEPELYDEKLKSLRYSIVKKLLYILNDVIMENEDKFSN